MNTVHAVFSPIFGIALHNFDELNLGAAKLFRNPAALAFSQWEIPFPNVIIPSSTPIEGAHPASREAYLRKFGIAKYLLEIEIETPTNELPYERVKEELEWAVLPLRILTDARILTGSSEYCQGGSIHSGLAEGGIIERVRREGILAPTLIPQGDSSTGAIAEEDSTKITEFASVVNKHRGVLITQLAVPIVTFSNSFYLPSYTDRGINLLNALEGLLSERGSWQGIKDKVTKRAADFVYEDRTKKKQTQRLIGQAFDIWWDIKHGSRTKSSETERCFESYLEELENVIRRILFQTVFSLDQGKEPIEVLPGLRQSSRYQERGGSRERG